MTNSTYQKLMKIMLSESSEMYRTAKLELKELYDFEFELMGNVYSIFFEIR